MTSVDILRLACSSMSCESLVSFSDAEDDVIYRADTSSASLQPSSSTAEPTPLDLPTTDVQLDLADSDSEFYDTDIESVDTEPVAEDNSKRPCSEVYEETCSKDSIAPQRAIVRSLSEKELNVRHRCLGDGDARALSVALCKNSSVTRLELGGNNVGALGAIYLKTVLTLNSAITYLDLSENDLGRHPASAIALGEVLRANTALETLKLSGNNFRDQDVTYLAAGILANTRLIHLDLSKNVIGETGSVHLGRAFAINNNVDVLDLSWNNIRQKGAVALCKGLQGNGYVSKLNISWNGFGYEGSLAMGELLKKNSTLLEIDLSANRINWQAVQFIAKGLAKNGTLETLKLNSNPLTTTGCMDLIEATTDQNSALTNLSLEGVPVIGDFELMLMMIRQTRPGFECKHGGVVGTHDVIGQRLDKRVTPIQKVINFMKEREYRTSELFRILDKDVRTQLSQDQLADRLKRVGIRLPKHEIDELTEFINEKARAVAEENALINYKTMAHGVKGQQVLEREEKLREQRHNEKLRNYHRKILTEPGDISATTDTQLLLPPIDSAGLTDMSDDTEENRNKKLMAALMGGAKAQTALTPTTATAGKNGKVISMSRSLGAKAVAFGKAGKSKKKKVPTATLR